MKLKSMVATADAVCQSIREELACGGIVVQSGHMALERGVAEVEDLVDALDDTSDVTIERTVAIVEFATHLATFEGDPDQQGLDPFALQHYQGGVLLLRQALAQFRLADLTQTRALSEIRR